MLLSLSVRPSVCLQEEQMLRQTALRLISVIGYSLSLGSLTLAMVLMGMLRLVHIGTALPVSWKIAESH